MGKYKELVISKIENGFVLKEIFSDNPKWVNKPEFKDTYFVDVDPLVEYIAEVLKK